MRHSCTVLVPRVVALALGLVCGTAVPAAEPDTAADATPAQAPEEGATGDGSATQTAAADVTADVRVVGTISAPAEAPIDSWVATSLLSHGTLSGDRANWREAGTEILYRATPALYLGGRIETRERNETTDALYTVLASMMFGHRLEGHASVTVAPDPTFSADEHYAAGIAWRLHEAWSLLADVSRLYFDAGEIELYKPGAILWFTERTFLTGRYITGRAYDEGATFDAYALRLDAGLPRRFRLALSAATGSDPEKEFNVPGVILTEADTFSAFLHCPVSRKVEFIVGAEYEDREYLSTGVYTRTTGAVGLSVRF